MGYRCLWEVTKTVLESRLLQEQADHSALTGPCHHWRSRHAARRAAGAAGSPGSGKGPGAIRGDSGTQVCLCAAAEPSPHGTKRRYGGVAAVGRGGVAVPAGITAAGYLRVQACLIQEAAYQSLLRRTRQQHHQHIAQVLVAQFPEIVETQPELLAHHYTEAGVAEQALPYWQRAGERAIQRSAHAEAIAYLRQGLDLLRLLPDTPEHSQQELILQSTLGPALISTRGYAAPHVATRMPEPGTVPTYGRHLTSLRGSCGGCKRFIPYGRSCR